MTNLRQTPMPGERLLRCAGDSIEISLAFDGSAPRGRAFVRTSIPVDGSGAGEARWRDVEMSAGRRGVFTASVPLPATGTYAFKTLFIEDGADEPVWPDGENVAVKVAPPNTRKSNSIYTAFVRQFSPDDGRRAASLDASAFDNSGWAAIPPSGTFRELARRLDHIVGRLGFHIIQLLPIHPVPTTYARMGRYGSPFASRDFFSVDPALAEFDKSATPMDQFLELVDAVHARGADIYLDLPANHTGWASTLQTRHPEWFRREGGGAFKSPGAWGVTWEDLVELDYSRPGLAEEMAEVFLFWCAKGVDGFRCDAGYMIPAEAWKTIVGRVRRAFPDTVFLLEGLGGELAVTDGLIADCGLDWAYSEIFQQNDRGAIEWYLGGALHRSETIGPLVNFAETHDNNRLAAQGEAHASMRTALAALLSQQGAFGITAGVEWFCRDKIDVHGAPPLAWGSERNQIGLVSRLNAILDGAEAFSAGARVGLVTSGGGNAVAALRRVPGKPGEDCLVAVNLDCSAAARVEWPAAAFGPGRAWNLVTFAPVDVGTADGCAALSLPPGGFAALVRGHGAVSAVAEAERARTESGCVARPGPCGCGPLKRAAKAVRFRFPVDSRREVMVPPGYSLEIESAVPFRALALSGGRPMRLARSTPGGRAGHCAVLPADALRQMPSGSGIVELAITGFGEKAIRTRSRIVALPCAEEAAVSLFADRARLLAEDGLQANLANARGAAAQAMARWGEIGSQYDALLAINTAQDVPASRQVFFTRCRAWIRHRGYSFALDATTQTGFDVLSSRAARWLFEIPAPWGGVAGISATLLLSDDSNAARLVFSRADDGDGAPQPPLTLVLRPDIEARDFHSPTRAYAGPEHEFPAAVAPRDDGFAFSPAGRIPCEMSLPGSCFRFEPEWTYCVGHPVEAGRGLEPDGDLFSPGWFSVPLECGRDAVLEAGAVGKSPRGWGESGPWPAARALPFTEWIGCKVPEDSLRLFLADRDGLKTVIAGYPWFLDWGRDTLIVLRGVIAAGYSDMALDILREFARFEERGTLPNIIHGGTVGNRDTSDAPLWFVVAAGDLAASIGAAAVVGAPCGGRSVGDAIVSVIRGYAEGTPNGVKVDPESGLVFSPPHFTWMDTNYPAGTPRAGYPVEIQALWIAALETAARLFGGGAYGAMAARARESFARLFALRRGWLSDCLATPDGRFAPARAARPDDALRPNQLLAVTLGAVEPGSDLARGVVEATEVLLVPGSIRSLDDAPVEVPQPVWHDGRLLNDPKAPYWGRYEGDEDTRRKPAYHNGTAWGWQFPVWCEAFAMATGDSRAARDILASVAALAERGSVGQLPEISDGDAPHAQRGCLAQAWSLSEAFRVWRALRR